MAESFEGKKIISNPLANLRPQKMQYGAKVGGFGKVNRQEVFTTTVKGSDAKGMYTDTNKNQANDFYPGSPAKTHTANAWFNGLTAQQKAAHNTMMRAKDAAARIPSATVPGMTSTNRVYDPVAPVAPKPGRFWTAEGTGMKFGGHTNRGTTSDQNVINSGMAKNKIDIQYPQSKNNTYESRAFTATENELWKKGKLNNSDNPIGRDTIGRAMQQKIMLASMNSPVKRRVIQTSSIATRKAGGTMMASKSSGCGCGDSKMQEGGPVTSMSMQTAKGSMMGATTAMMKQRKDKVKASSGTKTLGTISNMGMSSTPKYGMGTKKVMQDGGPVTPKPNAVKYKVPLTTKKASGKTNSSEQEEPEGNQKSYKPAAGARMPQPGKQVGRRRTMYADGGNIPQIDEESPIRYRR